MVKMLSRQGEKSKSGKIRCEGERGLSETTPGRVQWRRDLRSKIFDGLLPALVLYLLLMLILFGLGPIRSFFGGPGLMVYDLGLLGVSMFSLQRSLANGLSETTRAWYGMAAGVLVWSVVEISALLEPTIEPGLRGTILLILVSLVGALLWRHNLPLGARFFWITVCGNWAGSDLLLYIEKASSWSPALLLFYRATGFFAAGAAVILLAWVFLGSQRRVQRVWASLAIVMLGVVAVYIFQGSLYK
jgi:hypothetical protein